MTYPWFSCRQKVGLASSLTLLSLVGTSGIPELAHAQIIPDDTLGSERSLVTPANRIEGGASRGIGLFHSFSDFNIADGQQVYFASPAGIELIFSRVTGPNISNILGTLGVDGAANLYFLNPNGIVFGPNARLDIRGAFVASTADAFQLGEDFAFSAVAPEGVPSLTITVAPGLQYGTSQPGTTLISQGRLAVGQDLTLNAAQLDLQGEVWAGEDLTLQAQETLQIRDSEARPFIAAAGEQLLLQGNESVDIFALNHPDSGLFAGGDLILRSDAAVIGDAHFWNGSDFRVEQLNGQPGSLVSEYDPVIRSQGDVNFFAYQGASLHILAGGAVDINTVLITGPDTVGESINPTTEPALANVVLSDGTPLVINGSERPTLDIRAGMDPSAIGMPLGSSGVNFPDDIFAGTPASGSSPILPPPENNPVVTNADITIGDAAINAPDGLIFLTNQYEPNPTLTGGNIHITEEGIFGFGLEAISFGGKASDIILDARSNVILDAAIVVDARNRGPDEIVNATAGSVNIIAVDDVLLVGELENGEPVGISSRTSSRVVGNSGDISITSGSLTVLDGAILTTTTRGEGNAGNLVINVANRVLLSGEDSEGFGSGVFSQVAFTAEGNGGDIIINAGSLEILNGAELSTSVIGNGEAGQIFINVREETLIDGISSTGFNSGIFSGLFGRIGSNVEPSGDSGRIDVATGSLRLLNGGLISTSTGGNGDAGNISVRARESIEAEGFIAELVENEFEPFSGLSSNSLEATGDAGSIEVFTPVLNLREAATITTATSGNGRGGNIEIFVDTINLDTGGRISTSTSGSGNAGNIFLQVGDQLSASDLFVNNLSDENQTGIIHSGLFASTTNSSDGNGGSIIFRSFPRLVTLQNNAQISVESDGSGIGGNIILRANALELENGALLSAETASNQGGNITLELTDLLLLRNNSLISTEAGNNQAGGDGGIITVDVPFIVAVREENSDITANAFEGDGGSVFITGQGIYGIEFRDAQTPFSDITASSEAGGEPGEVIIQTPDLDPSRATLELPEEVLNVANLIDRSCRGSAAYQDSSFIITGRGGLPPNPEEIVRSENVFQPDFGVVTDLELDETNEVPLPIAEEVGPRSPLAEAQTWHRNADGVAVLTVQAAGEETDSSSIPTLATRCATATTAEPVAP